MSKKVRKSGRHHRNESKRIRALDKSGVHPLEHANAAIEQKAIALADTLQKSEEAIIIKDSCDITVTTTDTQAAVNLQAALQVAITAIVSVSIASSERGAQIIQELLQKTQMKQISHQKTYIANSRGVSVTATNLDIAANIRLLIQVLMALIVKLDILSTF
ncbi:spore coat protein [Aneurinibacillus terranovensis]|uniref:spore coat protein n=1 Tax=Aneurinibacillus terranovensis TaxID=278991 RepID=UPI0004123D7A|nr:spore coat protein [Aneurinibacillus terranovensis]